jgi:hypothetical protein
MNWASDVSEQIMNDSRNTFALLFGKELPKFESTNIQISTQDWEEMKVENSGSHRTERIKEMKGSEKELAEAAFPWDDGYRKDDVESVLYQITAENVSPVVVLQEGKKYTMLDGTHRTVAAFISGSDIAVSVIKLI